MHTDLWTVFASVFTALVGSGTLVKYFFDRKLEATRAELALKNSDHSSELAQKNSVQLAELNTEFAKQNDIVKGATSALASGYMASNQRRLDCISALWNNVLRMRHFAANIMYIYDVFPPGKYPPDRCKHILAILSDIPPCAWLEMFLDVVKDDESHRPFVGEHLWQQYAVYRTFMGRSCVKLLKSRQAKHIPTWDEALAPVITDEVMIAAGVDDQPLKNALSTVLEQEELAMCTKGCTGVPRQIITMIEGKMMECINDWVLGSAFADLDQTERERRYRLHFDPEKLREGRNAILVSRQTAEKATGVPIA